MANEEIAPLFYNIDGYPLEFFESAKEEGLIMHAALPMFRAPCLPVMTEFSFVYHRFIDRLRWMFFGESVLLNELKRLRLETQLQKQAMNYLCATARSADEAFGRVLTAQLSLYLDKGVPDPLRNHI